MGYGAIGTDRGFDIRHPLPEHLTGQYDRFVDRVRDTFSNDRDVYFGEHGFQVLLGDIPGMPYDGTRFRRFAARVRCASAGRLDHYIDTIAGLFEEYLGTEWVEQWDGRLGKRASHDWKWAGKGWRGDRLPGWAFERSNANRNREEDRMKSACALWHAPCLTRR